MNYLSTIAWHGLNVLTFKHKGEGLESASKENVITITALCTLLTAVAMMLEGNSFSTLVISLVFYIGFMVMFYKLWSLQRLSGVFCLFFVYACIRILNATLLAPWVSPENIVFMTWECSAMMVYVGRVK
jgi:uncharacterized Tic20 family protein